MRKFQRKLQDDLDEVNNKWRGVKEDFEKFEDDVKEKMEDEKRKVRECMYVQGPAKQWSLGCVKSLAAPRGIHPT